MTKSAYDKYDPEQHAGTFGWLWIGGPEFVPGWHLVSTIDDEDELRTYFVAADITEDADFWAGQPFMQLFAPPTEGTNPPGYILSLTGHNGLRSTFSWGAEGCKNGQFATSISKAVDNALVGYTDD